MSKEQRQPSAADLILARIRQEEAFLEQPEEDSSQAEQEELFKRAAIRRRVIFERINREMGLVECLEEINRRVLNGEGEVERIPLEEPNSVRLEWSGHRMTIYCDEKEAIIRAGGSFINGWPSFRVRPWSGEVSGWPEYCETIPFSTQNFRERFTEAIVEAFRNSKYMNTVVIDEGSTPDFVAP